MRDIVISYLDSQYQFKLSTYVSFTLFDVFNNKTVSIQSVLKSIKQIFDIDNDELNAIFDYWCDKKATELNTKIVDLQIKIYEKSEGLIDIPHANLENILDIIQKSNDPKCLDDILKDEARKTIYKM